MKKVMIYLGVVGVLLSGVGLWMQAMVGEPVRAASETAVSPTTTYSASSEVCTGTNLLENGSFEGAYNVYEMDPPGHPDCQTWDVNEPNQYCERVKMPSDWHPWWRDTPRPEGWSNIQPEYVPSLPHEIPPRVRSGEKSQHYFSFWSTHEAGMFQQVAAIPNGRYCFSIYGHAWSSRTTQSGWLSDPDDHGFLHQRVGIDPTGGSDWRSPTVIWSDERMQYDEFGAFMIEATAQANQITVFTYSRADVPVKHNDVYWDDAMLTVEKQMSSSHDQVIVMVDVDEPQTITRTVTVWLTPGLTYTAVLDSSGTLSPVVTPLTGSGETAVELVIDTSGLASGTYETSLIFTASDAETINSPWTIPVRLAVVPEIAPQFLPLLNRQ